ncbi:MAG: class I SAM-dependent methyltransferase [Chloroflexi bacterium]|nr:class I SAM-dependent methyltransferase [Chloroflexota bacterium]
MLDLAHRIAAVPWVYESIQYVMGFRHSRQHIAQQVTALSGRGLVLDVGGGTGLWRVLWPPTYAYLCLDIDPQKIAGFRAAHADPAILGDATQLPLADQRLDVVVCIAVSHHLTTPLFERLLAETARVLKPQGTFLFLDAVWSPNRLPSRLLWALDRGSYPRTAQTLEQALRQHFDVRHSEQYALYHRYLLATCQKAVLE